MTANNSNTHSTDTNLNEVVIPHNMPLVIRLVTGEDLIVSGLKFKKTTKSLIIDNPYGIYRQAGNIHNLFLAKWIPYTIGNIFSIDRNNVLTIGIPTNDLLYHYSECLQEEIANELDNDERINTTQISAQIH